MLRSARLLLFVALNLAAFDLAAFDLAAFDLQAAEKPRVFRAGAHAQDITPTKFPISVNGNMRDGSATVAYDRLHARCLVLDDGSTKIAIVVCDSCMIPRDITDAAKRLASKATGIAPDHQLIAATHAHSCPTVTGVFQSEPDKAYQEYLTKQIAQGIEKAHSNLAPAKVGWGVGVDKTQVFNRRWKLKEGALFTDPFGKTTDRARMNPGFNNPDLAGPAGPIDPEVGVLSLQTRAGRPLALLANYSLHYVGGVPALSADYFGAFAERIEQLLVAGKGEGEPPFVGIMSNGTSADINNVNFAAGPPKAVARGERVRVVADSVARAAAEAYRKIEHKDWVKLAMAQKELVLGVRLPSADDVVRAKTLLAEAKGPVLQKIQEIYARETVLLAKYPPKVPVILQAIRVGELGIAADPCETFVEIGLELKKKSALKPMFTIELANGYNGYLPTPEQHRLGGYETWRARSSYLEVDAAPKITRTLLELLGQVSR